jgi:hypothetical protein
MAVHVYSYCHACGQIFYDVRCPRCTPRVTVPAPQDDCLRVRLDIQGRLIAHQALELAILQGAQARQDTTLTELESRQLDAEDTHNKLVIYAGSLEKRIAELEDQLLALLHVERRPL